MRKKEGVPLVDGDMFSMSIDSTWRKDATRPCIEHLRIYSVAMHAAQPSITYPMKASTGEEPHHCASSLSEIVLGDTQH
jgi:hypothetical protein